MDCVLRRTSNIFNFSVIYLVLMNIKHLEQELIFSLDKNQLPKFREFLCSLESDVDVTEAIDCLTAKEGKHTTHNGVFNIETEDGEHLIVVREGDAVHVFLKKNNKFEQLREKFLKFIPITKP